jgi:hypothetical protein
MAKAQALADDGFHAEGRSWRAYLLRVKASASLADILAVPLS